MQVQIPDQKVLEVALPYNGPQPVHLMSLLVQKYLNDSPPPIQLGRGSHSLNFRAVSLFQALKKSNKTMLPMEPIHFLRKGVDHHSSEAKFCKV
jgi:hypothetical protein